MIRRTTNIPSRFPFLHSSDPEYDQNGIGSSLLGVEYTNHIIHTKETHRERKHISSPRLEVPEYSSFQFIRTSGGEENELFSFPKGLAVHDDLGLIYTADLENSHIKIFSSSGKFQRNFGKEYLLWPWGILVYNYTLYVADCGEQSIFKFSLPDLRMVKRAGTEGTGREEFNCPRQLAISPDQLIYVPDEYNNRIQVLNRDLEFQGTLLDNSIIRPIDLKFSQTEMFVLSFKDNPCVHIFTLSGVKIRSMLSRGFFGKQVRRANFFCLDACDNIIISDYLDNCLKVYSPKGELLHRIGKEGDKPGDFRHPTGVAILQNAKLVSVSERESHGLQIFST